MTAPTSSLPSTANVFLRRQAHAPHRDRSLIVGAVALVENCPPDQLRVVSSCPRCGASDHGVPAVILEAHPQDSPRPPSLPLVSLSRVDDLVAVALTHSDFIGVDVESIERVEQADMDAVAFHPRERVAVALLDASERSLYRTILWSAKEAILKAAGTGLMIAPETLQCIVTGTRVNLVSWPPELWCGDEIEVTVALLGQQHVCAVAHPHGALTTFSWMPTDA